MLDWEGNVSVELSARSEPSEPSEPLSALSHPVVFLHGMKCLICSSSRTPSSRSPLHTVSSPAGHARGRLGVGGGVQRDRSWQFFVVGVGFGGRWWGLVSTWSPPMGTEGSSQNQLKGADARTAEMKRGSSFTSSSSCDPFPCSRTGETEDFIQQEYWWICGGPATAWSHCHSVGKTHRQSPATVTPTVKNRPQVFFYRCKIWNNAMEKLYLDLGFFWGGKTISWTMETFVFVFVFLIFLQGVHGHKRRHEWVDYKMLLEP